MAFGFNHIHHLFFDFLFSLLIAANLK